MSFPVYATSPLPWAVVGVVVLAVAWRHLPAWLAFLGVALEILLVLLMTPLGATSLARAVEARAPPSGTCAGPQPTAIVVLAGGFAHSPGSVVDFGALRLVSVQRVFAGVALWHEQPNTRLVMSGGGGRFREAVVMANLAMHMGVPTTAIEIEDHSHTTWENAEGVAALTPPVPEHIWLVTSPMHIPRALDAFRAWGFAPCPWSAGPMQAMQGFSLAELIPQAGSARKAAYAMHELIGGVEYALLARRHIRRDAATQTP